jgi:hypothetical protein
VLKPVHLVFFWLGLCMDTAGTAMMSMLADGSDGSLMSAHGITGMIAIRMVTAIGKGIVLGLVSPPLLRTLSRVTGNGRRAIK